MKRVFLSDPSGDAIEVAPGGTLVGRGLGCDLRFADSDISREHLRLDLEGGVLVVEDLGSSNGSYVNGDRIRGPRNLQTNDTVRLGQRLLVVRKVDEADDRLLSAMTGRQPRVRFVACPKCNGLVEVGARWCTACGTTRRDTTQQSIAGRRHRRFTIDVETHYVSDDLSVRGVGCDVSLSGMFVAAKAVDQIGTRCTVSLASRGVEEFHINGVVRRMFSPPDVPSELAPPSGMGIEFEQVDRETEDRLCHLVDTTGPDTPWYARA